MVSLLASSVQKGTRTFPEFSEGVRSKFWAIGRADSAAPCHGRARGRRKAQQQYVIKIKIVKYRFQNMPP